eukprot:s3485_g3.t1
MVAGFGRRAIVVRDERMDEMQNTIDELSESLAKKEEALAKREEKTQEQSRIIKTLRSQADQRSMLTSMDMDNLKFEMCQVENKYKMEIADRNTQIKRMESENENLKLVERQLRREKDTAATHENGLQDVIDSLKDENVEIMAKNDSLRLRVTELLHRKMDEDAPSPYRQICDELREELMKTQEELRVRSEAVASNPILGEAILNLELDDAEKAKRMYEEVVKERDEVIRKNLQLYVDLQEANKRLSSSSAVPAVPVPLSPALFQGSNVERGSQIPDFKEWVTRISRKEHEKITLKPWPKCNDLDVWRSNVVQAVCVASGDPDTAAWREWLAPAQVPKPDYTLLSDSGDYRFQSIDSKLSMALQNLVENAGEIAYDVKVQIRQRSQELGKKGNFIMGREIFAMILGHFRTTSRDEVLFNASHIYKLQYRGDKEMDKFLNAWRSLEHQFSHPAIRKLMPKAKVKGMARASPEADRHLQRTRVRCFVTTTLTKEDVDKVTNALIVIRSTIGTRGRTARKVQESPTLHRSNTPKGKKDDHCYGWVKGACSRGDTCKFKHDPNMKGKKATPSAKADAKATPALVREFDDDDFVRAVPNEFRKNKSVKFNDIVDIVNYKKKDYVPCSWKSKSKNPKSLFLLNLVFGWI